MLKSVGLVLLFASLAAAQATQDAPATVPAQAGQGFKPRGDTVPNGTVSVAAGTHILLDMINSVSTKQAQVGDRLYLETAFPISANNKIVIPQGSWVTGTIVEVTRAKRARRAGQMKVRFDALTLPNGVSRSFRADLGSLDPRDNEKLNRENENVSGGSSKGDDAKTVSETTIGGGALGAALGGELGHMGRGAGIGAGAGSAAGVATILLSHGAEATLSKGSTVEMVLDRPLTFQASELDFHDAPPRGSVSDGGSHQPSQPQRRGWVPGTPW